MLTVNCYFNIHNGFLIHLGGMRIGGIVEATGI